jgi:uncharacterized coiled-coil DUF342 family protein
MLLSVVLPLLVLFYRRTVEALGRVDQSWKLMGLAAIKKEFAELWEVVREMERLSQRKPRVNERVEQYRNHLQQCGEDIPLCHKILNTVKLVAGQLARDCEEIAV